MMTAALIVSMLAMVVSVVAVVVAVWQSKLDRANAVDAACRQVRLDKALELRNQAVDEMVPQLDALFVWICDAIQSLEPLDEALRRDEDANFQEIEQAFVGYLQRAPHLISDAPDYDWYRSPLRDCCAAFPELSGQFAASIEGVRFHAQAYVAEVTKHAQASVGARHRSIALRDKVSKGVHGGLQTYGEFCHAARYVLTACRMTALQGGDPSSVSDEPYILSVEGSILVNECLLEEHGVSDDLRLPWARLSLTDE